MLRKIAVLVAVCMLLMTLSASALAEGAYTAYSTEELLNEAAQMWEELNSRASEKAAEKAQEDLLYVIGDGTCHIRTYLGKGGMMIIPAEIDGAQVTEIVEDAFYDNNTITGVVFADGLRLIGETSFYSTSKLSGTVTLPPSVKKVGSQAFLLSKLTAVNVLSDCSIGYRAFENTNAEFLYIREGCKASLGEASFAYNKELKTVVIPASVTSIDQTAFSNCPKMTIITPPGSFAETYAKLNMLPCNTKDYDQYVAQYEAMLLKDAAAALQ